MEIKFKGSESFPIYDGFDPETNAHLVINKGDIVDVSEKKAKQLIEDFPTHWELVQKAKSEEPKKKGK